jgi:predicted urease superfamily metal-dependent hydrolase
MKVKVVGVGKVKKQSLQAGENVVKKCNNIIRVIMKVLKDILYKVAIDSVTGLTDIPE